MQQLAPTASDFTTSPDVRMPPSAITGMSCFAAAAAHAATAVIMGTPMPATTRVVQMEPAPMPTLTAFTPAAISASVAPAVATLPAIRSTSGNAARIFVTMSMTPCEWPWAVSTTSTSTCAATSAVARSSVSRAMPTAAPVRRRPSESLHALGYVMAFWMSLTVMRPLSRNSWSTTRSFSTLALWRIARAWSSVVPTGTVMSRSLVITSDTGRSVLVSKRRSRLVRMPTSRPSLLPPSVMGTPEMRYFCISASAS